MEEIVVKVIVVFAALLLVGILLTAYEFREHILKRFRKRKK
jgi:hypothetical protein